MRCARVCGFCILVTLNLTSYAYSSTSPPLHGDGIFGSPVAPPVQVIPMLATTQITGPPVVDGSIVPTFATPQRNWRGSAGSPPTLALQSIQPPQYISYPQHGNAYAAIVSPSAAQAASSSQFVIPHRHITPAVPSMAPFSPAGEAVGVHQQSPSQASSGTSLVTSTQPAPSVGATPALPHSMPRDEPVPNHSSDLPQLKRTSPWLFSATREKLLGAIHFMKSTEEHAPYPYGYHADVSALESLNNAGSSPRDYYPHAGMIGLQVPGLAAGVSNSKSGIAADNYSQPQPLQLELLQRQEQLQQLQQRYPQQPQQQLQQHSREHKLLPSEEQAAIHLRLGREQGNLAQRQQETEKTQLRQGPQPQLKHKQEWQLLSQQHRPGGQHQATAEIPMYPPMHWTKTGQINSSGVVPYARVSAYASEGGKARTSDVHMGEGGLPYLNGPYPTSQAATAEKSETSYVESLVGQPPEGTKPNTQQVVNTQVDVTHQDRKFTENTTGREISGTGDALVAGETPSTEGYKAEEQAQFPENSLLKKVNEQRALDEGTPGFTPGKESSAPGLFAVDTAEKETRLQKVSEDEEEASDRSNGSIRDPQLTPVEDSIQPDAAEQPKSEKVTPASEAASTTLQGLSSESVASPGQVHQEEVASHAEVGEPDRATVASTTETKDSGELLSSAGGDKLNKQVEERTGNTSSSTTMNTIFLTPDVDATQKTTLLSVQNAHSATAGANATTTPSTSPPGTTNGEADAAAALIASAETVLPVAPSRLVHSGTSPAVLASPMPTNPVEVGSLHDPQRARSTEMLRGAAPGAVLLATSPPPVHFVSAPAMLQQFPVTRAPTGDPAFPASAVDKAYTLYPSSASYVAPQTLQTPFPVSSGHFLAPTPPTYVNPSMQTDARNISPPAPVYIGQSIRQDKRGNPPPVYPLGARLYEQMIPRAELVLASSTYAEEYLDLFAALYCLFHKWPCNNMQEFAVETRRRQDEMHSGRGGGKVVA